jgi:hypothetical protein
MIDFEIENFAQREGAFQHGEMDPGRELPEVCSCLCCALSCFIPFCMQLGNEFEFIPIIAIDYLACVHNSTRYDSDMFLFDNFDRHPCRLLHFQASHLALLVEAQSRINLITRLKNARTNSAQYEVNLLLELYDRRPGRLLASGISTQANSQSDAISSYLTNHRRPPVSRNLPTILGSPTFDNNILGQHMTASSSFPDGQFPAPAPSSSFSADGAPSSRSGGQSPILTPHSSFSTDIVSDDPLTPYIFDNDARDVDALSQAYMKERAVTWDELKTRPLVSSSEGDGVWRFSSAEQIIRGEW